MSGPGLGWLGRGNPLLSPVSPGPAPGSVLRALLPRACPRRHVRPVPWGWPSGCLGGGRRSPAPLWGPPPRPVRATLRCLGPAGWGQGGTGHEEAPWGAQPQGGAAWPEGLGRSAQTPLGKTQISRARLLARRSRTLHAVFSDFLLAFLDRFLLSLEIWSCLTLLVILRRL